MPHVAFLTQGKLHRCTEGGGSAAVETKFGASLRERATQIQRRHAWKTEGRGARFMTGMWQAPAGDPAAFRMAITSVCRGPAAGDLFYALETDEVAGIFRVAPDGEEMRLFHTADYRLRHLALSGDGAHLAASVTHRNYLSNIAVLELAGSGLQEVTEGDSFDLAPRWIPGAGRRLVYQSAGIGRDQNGVVAALGPFAVEQLDLESGALETLASDPKCDFLGPVLDQDGTLYAIRRPWEDGRRKLSPLAAVKDTLLFPFRLAGAFLDYFNVFSMMYSGKPLVSQQGGMAKPPDLKQMMIWGNVVNAQRAMQEKAGEADAPSLVPGSWELVRRRPAQDFEVLAKGVLSFDRADDGALLYSNGSAIYRLEPGAAKGVRIHKAQWIEHVAALA